MAKSRITDVYFGVHAWCGCVSVGVSAWVQKVSMLVEKAWPKMGAFRVHEGDRGGRGQFQPDRPLPLRITIANNYISIRNEEILIINWKNKQI